MLVLGGVRGSPLLVVDDGGIVRAVDDGRKLINAGGAAYTPGVGDLVDPDGDGLYTIADIENTGYADVLFEADDTIANESSNGTSSSPLWPMFDMRDTLTAVTIVDRSGKAMTVSKIDVVAQSGDSIVRLTAATTTIQFDLRHSVAPSLVTIQKFGAGGIALSKLINNPIGLTWLVNTIGSITVASTASIVTNILDAQAAGSIGAEDARLIVDLVRFIARARVDGPAADVLRDPVVLVSAGIDAFLSLRALDRVPTASPLRPSGELTVPLDSIVAGQDANLVLRTSVRADRKRQRGQRDRAGDERERGVGNREQQGRNRALPPGTGWGHARSGGIRDGLDSPDLYQHDLLDPPAQRTAGPGQRDGARDHRPVLRRRCGDGRVRRRRRGHLGRRGARHRRRPPHRHQGHRGRSGRDRARGGSGYLTTGDTHISLTGFINLLDANCLDADAGTICGWLDVNVDGDVTLKEVVGDLRVGLVRSRTGNVVLTAAGSILDADPADDDSSALDPQDVEGVNIDLKALHGDVGTPDDFLETNLLDTIGAGGHITSRAGILNASATPDASLKLGGVYLQEIMGNLRVGFIEALQNDTAATRTTDASVTTRNGSIVDGEGDALAPIADIVANRIDLFALGGGIGLGTNDLDINSSGAGGTGRLYAEATNSINITETQNELFVLAAKSYTGDVRLTIPDTAAPRGPPPSIDQPEVLVLIATGEMLITQHAPTDVKPSTSVATGETRSGIWAALNINLWVGDDVDAPAPPRSSPAARSRSTATPTGTFSLAAPASISSRRPMPTRATARRCISRASSAGRSTSAPRATSPTRLSSSASPTSTASPSTRPRSAATPASTAATSTHAARRRALGDGEDIFTVNKLQSMRRWARSRSTARPAPTTTSSTPAAARAPTATTSSTCSTPARSDDGVDVLSIYGCRLDEERHRPEQPGLPYRRTTSSCCAA